MSLYDPNPTGRELMPFDKGYCTFELFDSGIWYKVDVERLEPRHYKSVPAEVLSRAGAAIDRALDSGGPICDYRVDPAPYYEAALRKEFDDVRFLGTDFVPGVVC